jgi:hypothetical protein
MPRDKLGNYQCPFCGYYTTLTTDHYSYDVSTAPACRLGSVAVKVQFMSCANRDCRELVIQAELCASSREKGGGLMLGEPIEAWALRPAASMKVFPDCVPKPILNDYREACLTLSRSPKASATLSRRCLQGMIRDFWGVSGRSLFDEINAIRDKVSPDIWDEIHAVRELGNIGAHMAKDVDLIQDVEPSEAALLIHLIEDLIQGWYVQRAERESRRRQLLAVAAAKKAPLSSDSSLESCPAATEEAAEMVPEARKPLHPVAPR